VNIPRTSLLSRFNAARLGLKSTSSLIAPHVAAPGQWQAPWFFATVCVGTFRSADSPRDRSSGAWRACTHWCTPNQAGYVISGDVQAQLGLQKTSAARWRPPQHDVSHDLDARDDEADQNHGRQPTSGDLGRDLTGNAIVREKGPKPDHLRCPSVRECPLKCHRSSSRALVNWACAGRRATSGARPETCSSRSSFSATSPSRRRRDTCIRAVTTWRRR
jgi:hypothetical protein